MVELLADNCVSHGPTGDVSGPNGFRQLAQMYRTGFPDVAMSIDDQIAEGDRVVTRSTARGRHLGDFAGLAASGKAVAVPLILIDRIVGGRIAESWEAFDQLGLLQALGAIRRPFRVALWTDRHVARRVGARSDVIAAADEHGW